MFFSSLFQLIFISYCDLRRSIHCEALHNTIKLCTLLWFSHDLMLVLRLLLLQLKQQHCDALFYALKLNRMRFLAVQEWKNGIYACVDWLSTAFNASTMVRRRTHTHTKTHAHDSLLCFFASQQTWVTICITSHAEQSINCRDGFTVHSIK